MTIKEIRNKYKGYDLMALDNDGFYWGEFFGNWHAFGELGWNATDEMIEKAEIDEIEILEEEKTILLVLLDIV